jgi:addiction module HigA family antidote
MVVLADPSHPGEVLKELFLDPLGMSAGALAVRLDVPRTRIERLVKGETAMTADTALRLARFFGNTADFWMNLQRAYELHKARQRVDVSGIKPMKVALAS